MLKSVVLAVADHPLVRRAVQEGGIASRVAGRFVAGASVEDALAVVRRLGARGAAVTLDYLGEAVTDEAVARAAAGVYREALARIGAEGLDCSVSVKPTQLGMDLSDDLARELIAGIAEAAAAVGQHVTVDMESSDYTERTVALTLGLRKDGHANVGCAVQAYLRRTPDDVERLVAEGASLRLCKGAYAEAEDVALGARVEVARGYVRLADRLLGGETYARFATHDHRLIARVRALAAERGRSASDFEWQMLYGVREPLQRELLAAGERLRVYVPFGQQWYPYLTRRLAERPANLALFLRALATIATDRAAAKDERLK